MLKSNWKAFLFFFFFASSILVTDTLFEKSLDILGDGGDWAWYRKHPVLKDAPGSFPCSVYSNATQDLGLMSYNY